MAHFHIRRSTNLAREREKFPALQVDIRVGAGVDAKPLFGTQLSVSFSVTAHVLTMAFDAPAASTITTFPAKRAAAIAERRTTVPSVPYFVRQPADWARRKTLFHVPHFYNENRISQA